MPTAICAHFYTHAHCWLVVCGPGLKVSFLTKCTMKAQTTSGPPHLSLAFTSGLLKMISAHGGQALAFAFYWKHRDLEQRIYQL